MAARAGATGRAAAETPARLRGPLDRRRPPLARVARRASPQLEAGGAERGRLPRSEGPEPPRRDRPLLAHRAGALERLRRRPRGASADAARPSPSASSWRCCATCFGFASLAPVDAGGRSASAATRSVSPRSAAACRWSSRRAGSGLDDASTPRVRRRRPAAQRVRPRAGVPERRTTARCGASRRDGLTLRILRDNASLTRPAWIEADLARIFTEERYADFAALWLLAARDALRPRRPAGRPSARSRRGATPAARRARAPASTCGAASRRRSSRSARASSRTPTTPRCAPRCRTARSTKDATSSSSCASSTG